jgi:uncharacterized protein (TIGR02217 family)
MGASFHEVQFPPSISYGASGGPGFKTTILTLASGFEKRNLDWSVARAQYDVAHGLKTQEELNALIKFFYARRGKTYGFRFKDWADYQLPFPGDSIPVQMTTDGTTATFQITKIYGDVGNSYSRAITKPVPGTLAVFNNGVLTTAYAVDTTTGIVTLQSSIYRTTGNAISCTCEFDVPVRFDVDQMKVNIQEYNAFDWQQIPLVEVRDI